MNEEEDFFDAQYPAELYKKRPNPTAILSPLYDATFKGIFTQETEESILALKSFLSAVLSRKILTVRIKSNEPPSETKKQKQMRFDVTVEFDNGEIAEIEMQARKQNYDYGVRAEIQAARLLNNTAKKGKGWDSPPIYQISVLNFQYVKGDKQEMTWYTLKDETGHQLAERLNVIFIDLVAIRKKLDWPVEELTPIEKWGLFLSYVDKEKNSDYIKKLIKSEDGLMAAEKIVKRMSNADDNWYIQNSRYIAERDHYTIMANARKRGLEEGRAKGLAEGRAEGLAAGREEGLAEGRKAGRTEGRIEGHAEGLAKGIEEGRAEGSLNARIEAAKKLIQMKLSPEQIANAEDLPLEKVLELKKEIEEKA